MYSFRVAFNTVSVFIPQVLDAIIKEMADVYIKLPQNDKEWKKVAKGYQDRWNMPS